jgi:predicted PurR-regulated permease PerM
VIDKLTSRKFMLAVLSLLCSVGLVWFGKIADGVFATVIVATVGAYLTANVVQKREG